MIPNVRLLFLLGSADPLNVDASERELNEILATTDRSWQVHLVSSQTIDYRNLTCDYQSHSVPFAPSPNSILSRALYVALLMIKGIAVIRKYHIHAIVCKSGHLILGSAAYLVTRITHSKCIIRVNEDNVLDIVLFLKALKIPLISSETSLRTVEKVCRKMENCLFRRVDWIVTQGPMDYERIRKITAKVTFIPLWVDAEKFSPISKTSADLLRKNLLKLGDAKVVLFVGRLQEDKEFVTLFQAFKRLLEVRNDAVLAVIGRGPDEKKYEELVKQSGIADKVRFLGYIRHDDIAKYYNMADVYVLPSVWEEWSNTIMEAMACGIPVVATNVGANPYLVKDNETGFLFPRGDFRELAEKMRYVLDHPNEAGRISSRARLSIEKYTKQEIGESYKKVIEKGIIGK